MSSSLLSSAPPSTTEGITSSNVRTYIIPVPGDQNIVVTSNDLPANSDELSEVLIAVVAPLNLWLDFLNEYYRQNKFTEYEKLLRKALTLRKYLAIIIVRYEGYRYILVYILITIHPYLRFYPYSERKDDF